MTVSKSIDGSGRMPTTFIRDLAYKSLAFSLTNPRSAQPSRRQQFLTPGIKKMEMRPDYEVKLPDLARQVESDIRILRMQAESARNLAQRAASDCERNAQQTFAYQCRGEGEGAPGLSRANFERASRPKNVTCSKPGTSLARDTTLKPF